MRLLTVFLVLIFMVSCSVDASSWQLDNSQSSIKFISIKNNSIGEIHRFKKVQGELLKTGELVVEIDLASVDTNIVIRDDRMKEHLFKISQFPSAKITSFIELEAIEKLSVGESLVLNKEIQLELHGQAVKLRGNFLVTKLINSQIQVATVEPIIVNAPSFLLMPGIDKLKELAKLSSIVSSVPVSASLIFKKI